MLREARFWVLIEEIAPRRGASGILGVGSFGIPTGTGIGLNVWKTLAEMHGRSVSVESKKGEGSTFTVRLPVDGPEKVKESNSQAA